MAGNLLELNFTTETIGEKIVGDITYIKTSDYGWCFGIYILMKLLVGISQSK